MSEAAFLPFILSYFSRHFLWPAFTVNLLGGNVSDPFPTLFFISKNVPAFKGRTQTFSAERAYFLMGPPSCARHWVSRRWLGFEELPYLRK